MESARNEALKQEENRVSRDELNKEYSDIGLFFKQDEFQSVVDIMVEEKKAEREDKVLLKEDQKVLA